MSRKKVALVLVLTLTLSLLLMGAQGGFPNSAKGKGDYREGDPTGIYNWEYAFSAKQSADGIVSGYARESLTQLDPGNNQVEFVIYDVEIDVNCLHIFYTDQGWVAAVSGPTKPGSVSQGKLYAYYGMAYGEGNNGDDYYSGGWGSDDPINCMDVDTFPYSLYFSAQVHIRATE